MFSLLSSPMSSFPSMSHLLLDVFLFFLAHWNNVGCYFVTQLVNTSILFKQVHKHTHKAVSILHTYAGIANCWDIRTVSDCEQARSVVLTMCAEWCFIYSHMTKLYKVFFFFFGWTLSSCLPLSLSCQLTRLFLFLRWLQNITLCVSSRSSI